MNGPATAPVYKFLKASKSGFCGNRIKWNFTKFLVDKDGKVLARYGSTTAPLSIEVLKIMFKVTILISLLFSFLIFFSNFLQKDIEKALASQKDK